MYKCSTGTWPAFHIQNINANHKSTGPLFERRLRLVQRSLGGKPWYTTCDRRELNLLRRSKQSKRLRLPPFSPPLSSGVEMKTGRGKGKGRGKRIEFGMEPAIGIWVFGLVFSCLECSLQEASCLLVLVLVLVFPLLLLGFLGVCRDELQRESGCPRASRRPRRVPIPSATQSSCRCCIHLYEPRRLQFPLRN